MSSISLLSWQGYVFGQAGCNPPQKPDEGKQYIDDLGSKDPKNGWRIRLRAEEGVLRVLRSIIGGEKRVNIINELLKNLASGDYEKRKAIIRILVILLRSEKSDSSLFSEPSLRQRIADAFIRIFDQSAWGIKELLVSGLSALVKRGLPEELNSKIFFLLIASAKSNNWRIRAASFENLGSLFKSGLITLNLQKQIEAKKNEVIPALIAVIKGSHSDGVVKLIVAKLLIKLGARKQTISVLMAALEDNNSSVRQTAAEALRELKVKEAISSFFKHSKYGRRRNRVAKFLENLRELKIREAIPALIAALNNPEWVVRKAAAEALGKLKAREAIPALIAALKDNDSDVRQVAAKALGELNAQEAIPALITALKDNDAWVRVATAVALRKLKAREAIPALIAALKDSYKYVGLQAAKALRELKAREAIPALIAALKDNDNNGVRYMATKALGELKVREAIPALIVALRDSYIYVRGAAAEALGELKVREAIPALITALEKDNNSGVRYMATKALGKLNVQEAISALIAALKDNDSDVRQAAAKALGELKAREAIPALITALEKDNNSGVRQATAEALGKLKAQEAIPALSAALEDKDNNWQIKWAALEALREIRAAR